VIWTPPYISEGWLLSGRREFLFLLAGVPRPLLLQSHTLLHLMSQNKAQMQNYISIDSNSSLVPILGRIYISR
jgi:hypothetical protein